MRNGPSLKQVAHPRYEWRVRWKEGDKDCQKFFAKGQKHAAKAYVQAKEIEIGNHGAKHGTISDAERAAIIAFREAVDMLPEPRPSLSDCVSSYLAGLANQLTPVTIADLVAKRIAAAETKGVHQRTVRDLGGADGKGGRLGSFAKTFGERQASAMKAEEIENWVNNQCHTSANRREMLVRLRGLFGFGVKRGYLRENPILRLEIPRPSPSRAHILTVAETKALLLSCPGSIVPSVAVQLFAGIRRAEVERLDWKDIDFERAVLKITQRKGAGGRREKVRFVPLLGTLRLWLERYRQPAGPILPVAQSGPRKGNISAQTYRTAFATARKSAGLAEWDENTLRHSYGSYRLASSNDLERVRVEMGHTSSRTTSEHYVNAVREADAAKFWDLVPSKGSTLEVISLKNLKSA